MVFSLLVGGEGGADERPSILLSLVGYFLKNTCLYNKAQNTVQFWWKTSKVPTSKVSTSRYLVRYREIKIKTTKLPANNDRLVYSECKFIS